MKNFIFITAIFFSAMLAFYGCRGSNFIVTKSMGELEQDVKADPNNEIAHYDLGLGYYYNKDYSEAIASFNEAIKISEYYGDAYFAIYCAQIAENEDLLEAFSENSPANEYRGKMTDIHSNLRMAFMSNPFVNWTLASRWLPEKPKARIIKGDLGQNTDYTQQTAINIQNHLYYDGYEYFFSKEYQKALEIFSYLVEQAPSAVEEKDLLDSAAAAKEISYKEYLKDFKSNARFFRGLIFGAMGNYAAAAQDFSLIADNVYSINRARIMPIALEPDEIYFLIGSCYFKIDMYNKAEEAFKKVLTINKSAYMAHYHLSYLYSRWNKNELALAEINSALSMAPESSLLHYNKAYILSRLDKKDEALMEYEKAAELNARNYKAVYGAGKLYTGQGNKAKALDKFQSFITVAPLRDSLMIKDAKLKIDSLKTN